VIATIVNCLAVLIGSAFGMLFHRRVTEEFKDTVYTGVGVITIVIGVMMSIETTRILYVALSVVIGGLLGAFWNIEGGILRFGGVLEKGFSRARRRGSGIPSDGVIETAAEIGPSRFAHGFLNASILFCVGAMTIVGAFRAGAEGQYDLILTKSVMDGSMAILLTAALGPGVAFSIIVILIYQGGLTLLAGVLSPWISELVLSELSGTGGVLILMIGLNLLRLKSIKTGNFLPALLFILVATLLEPPIAALL
jgi:uncharacterized protein